MVKTSLTGLNHKSGLGRPAVLSPDIFQLAFCISRLLSSFQTIFLKPSMHNTMGASITVDIGLRFGTLVEFLPNRILCLVAFCR